MAVDNFCMRTFLTNDCIHLFFWMLKTNYIRTFSYCKGSLHVWPFGMCLTAFANSLSCLCKSQPTPRSSSSRLALGDQQSINLSSTPPLHLLLFLLHLHLLLLLLSTPLSSCLLPHLRLHHPPSPDILSLQASRLPVHPLSPLPPLHPSLLLLSHREPRSSTAGRVLPLPSSRLHQLEPQVLRLSPTWSQPPREQVCTTVPSLKTLLKHFQWQHHSAAFYTDN